MKRSNTIVYRALSARTWVVLGLLVYYLARQDERRRDVRVVRPKYRQPHSDRDGDGGQPANHAMGGGLNADDAGYGWAMNDQQATDLMAIYGGMGATGLRR
ncbi:MAG: hypothetical protein G5702_05190 [Serratia symbiotica]|nr:hypothetical protein [Serratia symbiotica]